jgi:hypothetical protein
MALRRVMLEGRDGPPIARTAMTPPSMITLTVTIQATRVRPDHCTLSGTDSFD